MTAVFVSPEAARAAMAQGWGTYFLDAGPGNPELWVYTTDQPMPGAPEMLAPALVIELAKPSGALVAGRWRLAMADPAGYQVQSSGAPKWARLLTASGTWAGDGNAGGPDSEAAFKLDKNTFQAGGYVSLGVVDIG